MNKLLTLTSVLIFSSCASIFSTGTYSVSLKSNPPETKVVVTNRDGNIVYDGQTPSTISLNASQSYFKRAYYNLNFSKKGYYQETIPVTFGVDPWYWANLILFPPGLIGTFGIDPDSGAMYTIDSQIFKATLKPK